MGSCSISFQFLPDSMQRTALLLSGFLLANKSHKVLTSHFSRDFSRDYHSCISDFKEPILWQSLSSPTRILNAVKIGGM